MAIRREREMTTLQVAQIVPCTEAEGPGKRFAVWFQGCPLRCPGCCNPEFLPFSGGESRPLAVVAAEMLRSQEASGIEGITLLGGEPFAHAAGAAALARFARENGLSVMVFSGYALAELQAMPPAAELLAATDILVDGPYRRDQPDASRRWIGSTNQQIHFLTDRYGFDDQWRQRNTLEIRVRGNEVHVNGFPAKDAVGLWKGWKRKTIPGSPPR
jgi:anaerobic ribonucleoside-triphosphate reductase activating protein